MLDLIIYDSDQEKVIIIVNKIERQIKLSLDIKYDF